MAIQSPTSEARVEAMFDRIAPRYDFLNRLLSARQDIKWRRQLVSMIPYRPGGRFLDVATGTGDVLLAAAQAHPEYKTFVGTDISQEMLNLAQSKLNGQPAAIELQKMSAERLVLPDHTFDCVSIAFGLRNVVDRDRAIREFYRVLAPGGVLLILEFFPPRAGLLSVLFQFYFHQVLPRIGALFSDRDAYRYLPQSVGSFYSAAGLRTALHDAGFLVDNEVNFVFGSCRLVRGVKKA